MKPPKCASCQSIAETLKSYRIALRLLNASNARLAETLREVARVVRKAGVK